VVEESWNRHLRWVEAHTPYTKEALKKFAPPKGLALVVRFHVDLKMIPLLRDLSEKLSVKLFPCHADTTDSLGWEYLERHTDISLEKDWSYASARDFLSHKEGYLCDLGGEMITDFLERGTAIRAALEGTTSGIRRIEEALVRHPLSFPILDWNQAPLKNQIHNEKMVGFSLWQTFTEVTRLSLHGKRVGVLGFGPVGRGIARTARALGGTVAVYDPSREATVNAKFEGYPCLSRKELLKSSQVLVTATGTDSALKVKDLELLCEGAFLVNAGHSESEIDPEIRNHGSLLPVLEHVEELSCPGGNTAYLLSRGRLLNLSAGFGDTINAFDITTCQLVSEAHKRLSFLGPNLPPQLSAPALFPPAVYTLGSLDEIEPADLPWMGSERPARVQNCSLQVCPGYPSRS